MVSPWCDSRRYLLPPLTVFGLSFCPVVSAEEGNTAMEVEDEDEDPSTSIQMANQLPELGISTFHTNLFQIVGQQPKILEDKVSGLVAVVVIIVLRQWFHWLT